jgi:glycosyltransferase involved in cell wall biosynthesis
MDHFNYRRVMRAAAHLSDRILAISNHGKTDIETRLDIPAEKVRSVYLGAHPKRFFADGPDSRDALDRLKVPADYFLFVGTDYPHKNLVTLLKAFDLVRRQMPDTHLVLVGARYHQRRQPEQEALLSRLADRVLSLGHVADEVLPALYHHAAALVYPSLYEGFGLPLLEAMLCGTPIIASSATSIPEVCGEAALMVDGRDAQQMAQAMLQVRGDAALASRLIQAGYEQAQKFTWERTARETLRGYQDTLQQALRQPHSQRVADRLRELRALGSPPPAVLVVTHIRFYPPSAGNEQRLFRMVKYFKKLGYRVVMLVNPFLEKTSLDPEWRQTLLQYVDYYEEIGDVAVDDPTHIESDSPIGREAILERWRNAEESFCSQAVLARTRDLIAAFSPKVLLAEYIWTSRVFSLVGPEVLKLIDTIDMFSHKNENVVRFGIQDSLAMTPEEELAFINRSDAIIAIQDSEAQDFHQLGPSCQVITAGIDLDVDRLHAVEGDAGGTPTLLIVGSGNQINVHCVNEFLEHAWPKIRTRIPACTLKIVGKVGQSIKTRDPRLELVPYVQDLDIVYQEAAVVVNPVYAGTGIKVKSVEALGHGKALVSWPEGVAGLTVEDPPPFIMIHGWEELVESIASLCNDPSRRRDLEKRAREYARSNLSDRKVYQQLADRIDVFSKRNMKILCLYLRYGTRDYPEGLADLQAWYARKLPEASITIWVIDNKIEGQNDGIDLQTGHWLLSGDNQAREFSAFQKVLVEHREEIEAYDLVHFVTSAFNTLFTGYMDYFSPEHLSVAAHRPICLGHLDSSDEPLELAGETSQSWIRTCFFFMAPETAYSIPSFVAFREESRFFDSEGEFLKENELSENYQKLITSWLNGEAIQGVTWHSRITDPRAFMGKTLAILNEHMLSVHLRKAGVGLVDFYWLKENYPVFKRSANLPVPDCLEQVTLRQLGLYGIAQTRGEGG